MANLSIAQVNTVSKSFTLTGNTYDNTVYGATIQALDGDETISNSGLAVSISSGVGDDSIFSSGSFITICAGLGNDNISLASGSKENLIRYAAGNDIVAKVGTSYLWLLNAASLSGINIIGAEQELVDADKITTLIANDDTHNGSQSEAIIFALGGNDIVLTVDDGSVSLIGAATLSTVNIDLVIPSIPADALHYNGHYYYLFNKSFTWEDAQAYSESRGGHLVTITDKDDQDAVQSLLDEKGSKIGYWLGGYKNVGGAWQWITDEDFSYTNWSSDQPDGSGNFLHMYAMKDDGIFKGKWEDTTNDLSNVGYTTAKQDLICEWGDDTASDSKFIRLTENADFYHNLLDGATILALGDNDTIGNDTVWGISASSTLNLLIDKKSHYSSVTSGNDIKINVVGGSSITLKDAKNKSPHIIIRASGGSSGGSGNSDSSGNNSSSNGSSGNGNRSYYSTTRTSTRQNIVTVPSGNQFFANYQSRQKLYLGSEYTGAFFDNAGDFIAGSATGAICIRNALEKVIDFSDGAGNLIKAYAVRNAAHIDGAGADLFLNASVEDVVNLNDATIGDITSATESGGKISILFNTGNTVNVQSSLFLSAKFILADGAAYRYSHATKSWRTD